MQFGGGRSTGGSGGSRSSGGIRCWGRIGRAGETAELGGAGVCFGEAPDECMLLLATTAAAGGGGGNKRPVGGGVDKGISGEEAGEQARAGEVVADKAGEVSV